MKSALACWCAVAAVVMASCLPTRLCAKGPPQVNVTVVAATTTISACDPLYLKVEVMNATGAPLPLTRGALSTQAGVIQFELRSPRHDTYSPVSTRFQGLRGCNLPPLVPVQIPAGGTHGAHEVLFWDSGPIFPEPGDYELRAQVHIGKQMLRSNSVKIAVTKVDAHDRRIIDEANGVLAAAIGSSAGTIGGEASAVQAVRGNLRSSGLGGTLRWLEALLQFREAGSPGAEAAALARLDEARERLPLITREVTSLALAEEHMNRKQWRKAKALLESVKGSSDLRNRLLQQTEADLQRVDESSPYSWGGPQLYSSPPPGHTSTALSPGIG